MTIKEAVRYVTEGRSLSQEEAFKIAMEIMSGESTPAQISALLVGLNLKGETIDEITGFVKAMREKVTKVVCENPDVLDTCGTGGDGSNTFNISTISALVAAGAGCSVAKHGNRSVSSLCGSADLLQELGVNIEITPDHMARCIDTLGIGFLYAPALHPAMKYAIGPRREIGIRTIFNILGPLTNPAGASRQLLGVFERDLTEPLARVLDNLGSMHALIVHGEDGLDEITITGKTYVSELKNGTITNFSIHPEDYGIAPRAIDRIRVQTIKENIACVDQVFNNSDHAKRDIVLLNAGAAIYVSGKASSIAKGIDQAREAINSGNAKKVLTQLVEITK